MSISLLQRRLGRRGAIAGSIVAMPSVLIGPAEARLLADLVGHHLDSVVYDGWAAYLQSGELALQLFPVEVHTPTAEDPRACISRPAVERLDYDSQIPDTPERVARSLGAVTTVSILHTIVNWSALGQIGPANLVNTEPLPGNRYGSILTHPRAGILMGDNVFPSDLGILLDTDLGRQCLIYTHPAGYFVFLAVTDSASGYETLMPEWESPADLLPFLDLVPLAARF